jgi:ribose transport system permease protein
MSDVSRDLIANLRKNRSGIIGLGLLAALAVAGAIAVDGFLSFNNILSMLLLAAFLGLASLGQTLVALLGGLDLSIPYVIGSANILLASLLALGVPAILAILLTFVGGVIVGIVNGVLSFRLQGQSLILSLGIGFAVVGGAQILASIGSSYGGNNFGSVPDWLANFSSIAGTTFGLRLPAVVILWIIISVCVVISMTRNRFGRAFYAVGGSRTAAARLLISEFRTWVAAYAISGGMAALTGVVLLGFSGGGFVGVGDPYLFTTVAAVVIGGTSLLGGWGGYGATIIGVLVLTVLTSLLVGLGLSYAAQQAVFGLMIVPMVAFYARSPSIRMQI